jgi:hypothetical protein
MLNFGMAALDMLMITSVARAGAGKLAFNLEQGIAKGAGRDFERQIAKSLGHLEFNGSGILLDRLAAQRFRSVSGIEKYDRLAAHSPNELLQFLRDVEANGWIVKPTTKLPDDSIAWFLPRKGRFYYDPERMTVLDMLHEQKHLDLFIERGNWKLGKKGTLVFQDEIAAYSHELELLRKAGGADPKYIMYLKGQIEYNRSMLRGEGISPLRPSTMQWGNGQYKSFKER